MEYKRLDECCISISDGDHQAPPKADIGVPFITISNIDETFNTIDFDNTMFVRQDYYDKIDDKRKAQKGDILYSVVGSFGIPVLIRDDKAFAFQRHIAILRPNKEVIMSEYLYYVLKSREFYAQADTFAIGAAQRTISLTSLRRMKVRVPFIQEQKSLIDIMGSIDKLICNNTKRINLLESMIENLYKEWFVRFRFPGHEEVEFSAGVPKDWKLVRIEEIIRIDRGLSYSSEEIDCEDGIDLVNLKNIQAYGGYRTDGTKKYSGKYKVEQVVKTGDLVMGVTDMTQDRRTVGSVALIPIIHNTSAISADLIKLSSEISNYYLYSMFRYGNISRYISQFANGANVLHLRPQVVNKIKVYLPTEPIINQFSELVRPIIQEIDLLNEKNDNLIKQRDLLLPRLMSGKLEVK